MADMANMTERTLVAELVTDMRGLLEACGEVMEIALCDPFRGNTILDCFAELNLPLRSIPRARLQAGPFPLSVYGATGEHYFTITTPATMPDGREHLGIIIQPDATELYQMICARAGSAVRMEGTE